MAPDPIRVAVEDEVPAIIERLRRSSAEEVHLLLPGHSRFGQSRFNFQLLRQYSTRLGKRVSIASDDPVVQRLAEESGFGFVPLPSNGVGPEPAPRGRAVPRAPARATPLAAGAPVSARTAQAARAGARMGGAPVAGVQAAGAARAQAAGAAGAVPPAGSRLGGAGGAVSRPMPQIQIGAPRRLPGRIAVPFQPSRYVLYGGAALVLVAGILAVAFYVPSARVTLVAQAQPLSTQVDVAAQPGKPPIHVRPVSLNKQASLKDVPSTGTKVTPGQYATGQFTYVNTCAFDLNIPNGQRLHAVTGMAFAQIGDLQVGHDRAATATVKATQTGQAGNVGAGQITAIDNNQFPCLTGTNQAPAAGGTEDQKQTAIQSSDLQTAKAQLEQQVRQQVLDELGRGLQRGEKLVGQPVFSNEDFKTTHAVDETFPNFTATLTLTAEGDYYSVDDVDQAFAEKLRAKVPASQQLTTNKVAANYTVTATPGGHLDFNGSANGFVAPRIDLNRLRGQMAGKSAPQAHEMLTRLPVRRSDIEQAPLPLPLMPLTSSRIYVEYVFDQSAAPRSA